MRLLQLSPQLVHLSGRGATVLLGLLILGLEVSHLALPLVNDLVERTLALLGLGGDPGRLKLNENKWLHAFDITSLVHH